MRFSSPRETDPVFSRLSEKERKKEKEIKAKKEDPEISFRTLLFSNG